MDLFQLCQHVSTIESTIEFLFETEMLSANFNCHLCGTECTLVEEEEDEDTEAPRSPNSLTYQHASSPSKKYSTPKGSPQRSNTPKNPSRQYSFEDDEASVRSIAYASVLGGSAAAATISATHNAISATETAAAAGALALTRLNASNDQRMSTETVHENCEKDVFEDANCDEEGSDGNCNDDEEKEEEDEEEDREMMKVSESDRFWWSCPRCDETFSIRTDSMFEASALPLQRLVVMIYCFSVKVPRPVAGALAGVTPEQLDAWYEACHGVIDLLENEGDGEVTDELRALQTSQREAERAHVNSDHTGDESGKSPEKSGRNGIRGHHTVLCVACGGMVEGGGGLGGSGTGSDDGEDWKAKAIGIGALELAEQETDAAEGEYDRLLHEEGLITSELRDLKDYKLESALRKIKRLISSSQEFEQLEKLAAPIKSLPLIIHSKDSDLDHGPGSQQSADNFPGSQKKDDQREGSGRVVGALKALLVVSKSRNGEEVSSAISEVESSIRNRIGELEKLLVALEKDKDKALGEVETWRARQGEAPNYDEVMKRREREWLEREKSENEKCLNEMRRFIPRDVTKLSKSELQQNALNAAQKYKANKGEDVSLLGVYPADLAIYFKECSMLHWLVLHQHDIKKSNFLLGDSSTHFQNLEKYDVVEMRAVAAVLPDSFEFDQDGRKADWKASFLTRLKTLTQQQERAKVRCGWDPEKNSRREVTLPELGIEQKRRSIYFYASDKEAQLRLAKMDTQAKRLKEKKERLQELKTTQIPSLKAEYDAVLGDGRADYFKQLLGKSQLGALRDEAKRELDGANKELKKLEMDVVAGDKSAAAAPVDRNELVEELRKVRELPNGCWRRIGDRLSESTKKTDGLSKAPPCVSVRGPFDPNTAIAAPAARSLTRKLSVEEEALLRVEEMKSVMGGDEGEGGGIRRRSSVKERMEDMEKLKRSESQSDAVSNEPTERVVTAAPVPAKSMRVARLLERLHQEKLQAEQLRIATEKPEGVPLALALTPGEWSLTPGEWSCALCNRRNTNSAHLCSTCGRPRGMISAKPRRDLTISHHALTAAVNARKGGNSAGGSSIGVAFGRSLKEKGDAASTKPAAPQKNNNMMAELQAKLNKRRPTT